MLHLRRLCLVRVGCERVQILGVFPPKSDSLFFFLFLFPRNYSRFFHGRIETASARCVHQLLCPVRRNFCFSAPTLFTGHFERSWTKFSPIFLGRYRVSVHCCAHHSGVSGPALDGEASRSCEEFYARFQHATVVWRQCLNNYTGLREMEGDHFFFCSMIPPRRSHP